jgi:hypothetical protein
LKLFLYIRSKHAISICSIWTIFWSMFELTKHSIF